MKNFVPAKGARLLRKVAKHILAEPLRYDQNSVIMVAEPGSLYGGHEVPSCGTVACIGGWLKILTDKRGRPCSTWLLNYGDLAKKIGVSEDSVWNLFAYTHDVGGLGSWPQQFRVATIQGRLRHEYRQKDTIPNPR